MMEAYKDYLRGEVKSVLPIGSLFLGILTLICIVMSTVKGELNKLGDSNVILGPNVMYLFMAGSLFLSITISYLLSKKYAWAPECVVPIFTFLSFLIGIPMYY
jgi:hypothetical protein